MADTVTERWIYPPNWDGFYPDHRTNGHKRFSKVFTCVSDGTGETDVKKIDISELRCPDGREAVRTVIDRIEFDCLGFTSIRLEWDRTPDETIAVLSGAGQGCVEGPIVDPGGEGTGDILLTTVGYTSGDSYMVRIDFRVKPE